MSIGNLIFLLVVVGGAVAMFSMHRGGGHSHGTHGGDGGGDRGHGSSGGEGSPNEPIERKKPLLGKPGTRTHEHAAEPAADERRNRHC